MHDIKLSVCDYTIGWISALPLEAVAAIESMDEEHDNPDDFDLFDPGTYSFGSREKHNIVIARSPGGEYGTSAAATVAARMQAQFKGLRFGLMVGIGGGVPSPKDDIRLGDIVVSKADGKHGGVVLYDMGKAGLDGEFVRTGHLDKPPDVLRNAVSRLKIEHLRGRTEIPKTCAQLGAKLLHFAYPEDECDQLYNAKYPHTPGMNTCANYSDIELVPREPRMNRNPVVHFGTIASGNQFIKDATKRDELSRELGGVFCYEMEAASLMNKFPCIVIRGICDYANSHKTKD